MTAGEYFDRQAQDYYATSVGMAPIHRLIAAEIERGLHGRVLSIGGIWSQAKNSCADLTVLDASAAMLRVAPALGQRSVRGDALRLPFAPRSFDHVVMPLILHHLAGTSGTQARDQVRRALREAHTVLKPGGNIWISEFCPTRGIYALELLAAPVTRFALGLLRTPLVVMHSASFYAAALREAGFVDANARSMRSVEARATDLITPIIGVPFIKVPRALYPVIPTLITARAANVR